MIVVTIFVLIMNETEFSLVHDQNEKKRKERKIWRKIKIKFPDSDGNKSIEYKQFTTVNWRHKISQPNEASGPARPQGMATQSLEGLACLNVLSLGLIVSGGPIECPSPQMHYGTYAIPNIWFGGSFPRDRRQPLGRLIDKSSSVIRQIREKVHRSGVQLSERLAFLGIMGGFIEATLMHRLNITALWYPRAYTEKTSIPFPFKLNGIWSWWQFSFEFLNQIRIPSGWENWKENCNHDRIPF